MIKLKVHKMPAFYTQKNAFSTNLLWDAGVLKQKCKTTRNTISNCKEIQNNMTLMLRKAFSRSQYSNEQSSFAKL